MDFAINTTEDYSKLVEYLYSIRKIEDDYHRSRHLKIINTSKYVISVDTLSLRKIAKSIYKSGYENYLKLASFNTYEESLIFGLVISHIKDIDLLVATLPKFINHIDTWAECDTVVSSLKQLKRSSLKSKYFDYFYNMCFSHLEFEARFGIVTLMVHYLEEEYIDRLLHMCKTVSNHKYYVDMALSWLISFAFMKFKDKTYALLSERVLTPFVQNKAISKCRDSYQVDKLDKEQLVMYRIK